MAIIKCPHCRRQMDVVLKSCPGCGKALVRDTGWRKRPIVVDVVGFVGLTTLVLWLIWWILTGPSF